MRLFCKVSRFSHNEVISIHSAKLNFDYNVRYTFSSSVTNHHVILRCIPHDTHRQKLCSLYVSALPDTPLNVSFDSFGNKYYYFSVFEPHDYLSISVHGTVMTFDSPDEEYDVACPILDLYKMHTRLTDESCDTLKMLEDSQALNKSSQYEKALTLMHYVHSSMEYISGVTDISTTASQAATLKRGVCQDYAHLLVSLLRSANIPARYCAGMISGEGETHAWAEVYLGGYWYGLDPTANLLVEKGYIKLSHGRDFSDCLITKGIFKCFANQRQQVSVFVQEQ